MIVAGILLIAFGLYCAYMAGAHDQHAAEWKAQQVADQYATAMAAGKSRHPSRLDAA